METIIKSRTLGIQYFINKPILELENELSHLGKPTNAADVEVIVHIVLLAYSFFMLTLIYSYAELLMFEAYDMQGKLYIYDHEDLSSY